MWAFLAVDESQGEGVIGECLPINGEPVFMPFVCSDKVRVDQLKPRAKAIAKETGKKVRLVKFSLREELEVINDK